jgi:hypothetical protein
MKTKIMALTFAGALSLSMVAGVSAAPAPKVTICHANNGNGGVTITVSENALAAHWAHLDGRDTFGECGDAGGGGLG